MFLDAMKPMEKTNSLLAQEGTTFNNAFVNTPICCPSRFSKVISEFSFSQEFMLFKSHVSDRPISSQLWNL